MEMFDPVHNEWVKQAEPDFMSTSPHVGSLACTGDYLYVIGGSDNSGLVKIHVEDYTQWTLESVVITF